MKRVVAGLAVLALFLIGIAVGALGAHLYYARELRHPGAFPHLAGRFFAEHLERRLLLTPEQRREIDLILRETHERARELRGELEPQVREVMESASARIEGVLTPEQREEFQRLRREQRRRAEHFLLGPPGPRRGPGPPVRRRPPR